MASSLPPSGPPEAGRLQARPHPGTPSKTPMYHGPSRLNLGDSRRDGWLYVPPTYQPDVPSPLVVMLHGAGDKCPWLLTVSEC